MGFFGSLIGGALVLSAMSSRYQDVSEYKAEYEKKYADYTDRDLFEILEEFSPNSPKFAAISLMLQDRGYSSDEVVDQYKKSKR